MLKTAGEPQWLSISFQLYRVLLSAYPSEFHTAYAGPMLQVFQDTCRRAEREGGAVAVSVLWARTALDFIKTVIEEHARGGVQMTREKFFKLSGWAMILGPVLFLAGWLAANRPQYDQNNFYSLPVDRYANLVGLPLVVFGILFMSLGYLGMLLRYGSKAGRSGLLLGIGALSGLVSAAGVIGMGVDGEGPWWNVFIVAMFIEFTALSIFGVINLRRRVLERWNSLPLLAWVWFPGMQLLMGFIQLSTGTWPDSMANIFTIVGMIGIFMSAGLGYLLQSNGNPVNTANA